MGSAAQKGSRIRELWLRPSVAGMEGELSFRGDAEHRTRNLRDSPMCNCTSEVWSFGPSRDDECRFSPPRRYIGVIVSFTAATSWLSVKGFGRNANCWFSGRLFSNASSA